MPINDHAQFTIDVAPAWAASLRPGDVVVCAMPTPHGGRRPEPRPCVLLDVESLGSERLLSLAPGSPAAGRPTRRGDLYATADDVRPVKGLVKPHTFRIGRRMLVPLRHPSLVRDPDTGSPLLGRLGSGARDRLDDLRARIDAQRHIAADHRRRLRRRRRGAERGRDFVVEHRRSGSGHHMTRRPGGAGEGTT